MKKTFITILIGLTLFTGKAFCQNKEESNKIGLSGTLQSGQMGVLMPLSLGEKFALVPAIDFTYAEDIGTDIGIAISPRFYLKKEKILPYWGFRIGTLINIPVADNEVNDETKFDILAGLNFGGEYFIADQFSLGVEAQGNFTKSDKNSSRFGNPGAINFNLGTMIFATVYF